jgi:hypothetical protein
MRKMGRNNASAVWYFAAVCMPESGVVFCRMMEKRRHISPLPVWYFAA